MKLLLVGTDRDIFKAGTAVRNRIARFGSEHTDALDSIVLSTKKHGAASSQELAQNVHVHPTNSISRFLYGIDALQIARKLLRPDAISAQDPFETGLVALLIARHFHIPLMVEVHTDFLAPSFARHSLLNHLRVMIAGFVLRRASGGYVVSEKLKRELQERYRLSIPIDVLPIYVDTSRFASVMHTQHPRFATALLWVGRLEEEKNPVLALHAFIDARKAGHNVGLTIVGAGSLLEQLKSIVKQEDVEEWVEFPGHVLDVLPFYKTADLLLVTSTYEGYGMVIVEALSAKIPVLSSDVGVARESGAIISDSSKYASALISWLSGPRNPGILSLQTYQNEEEYFARVAALYATPVGKSRV